MHGHHKTKLAHNIILPLGAHTYVHRSWLYDNVWGKVPCNGMVYINNKEAIVFDTPTNDTAATELIDWLQGQGIKIRAVVVNHFHGDCLGGLKAFHDAGIPSYANNLTLKLAGEDVKNHPVVPQNGFDGELILTVGSGKVINRYCGEAHTKDNIVSYVPEDRALFGGCMVKEMGAGKGNLNDANQATWPATIAQVKQHFGEAKYVVPGHGRHGDTRLLDYTIKLFSQPTR